jgi:hypothetical protein
MNKIWFVLEVVSLAAWRLLVIASLVFSLIILIGFKSLQDRNPKKVKEVMSEIFFDGIPQEDIKTVTIESGSLWGLSEGE